eukprot:CAMPEP_0196653644 /NCGR_PEP_ID=MMETSP1086-20130531/3302_1 /TAXON_ID=77921 /ORGANISM="Cyanoptyche  gloeocystis , Strain SAG4.97" /LENGTH=147 /DNA_ID=CAMNT_0041984951 /DNA_START=85 /DNA_END=528 /DNA_ORIENTATION=-
MFIFLPCATPPSSLTTKRLSSSVLLRPCSSTLRPIELRKIIFLPNRGEFWASASTEQPEEAIKLVLELQKAGFSNPEVVALAGDILKVRAEEARRAAEESKARAEEARRAAEEEARRAAEQSKATVSAAESKRNESIFSKIMHIFAA